MGWNYIPWPIIILALFLGGMFFIVNAIKIRKKSPTAFVLSYFLLGISFIFFGFLKIAQVFLADQSSNIMVNISTFLFTFSIPLLLIGGYQKVKNEGRMGEKVKKDFILVGGFFLFCVFFTLFVWFQTR